MDSEEFEVTYNSFATRDAESNEFVVTFGSNDGDEDEDSNTPPAAAAEKARNRHEFDDGASEISNQIKHMLTQFSDQFGKRVVAKRKRVEKCTSEVIRSYQNKVGQLLMRQQQESDQTVAAMTSQVKLLFGKWDNNRTRINRDNEKIAKIVTRQCEDTQRTSDLIVVRMKELQDGYNAFLDGREKLLERREHDVFAIRQNLHNELNTLKKKVVSDLRKTDMENMSKSIETLVGGTM